MMGFKFVCPDLKGQKMLLEGDDGEVIHKRFSMFLMKCNN